MTKRKVKKNEKLHTLNNPYHDNNTTRYLQTQAENPSARTKLKRKSSKPKAIVKISSKKKELNPKNRKKLHAM